MIAANERRWFNTAVAGLFVLLLGTMGYALEKIHVASDQLDSLRAQQSASSKTVGDLGSALSTAEAQLKQHGITPAVAPPQQIIEQGQAGPKGDTGAVGPSGPSGAPGATGPAGPSGSAGSAGPAGPAGPSGAAGATGEQGPAGPAGPSGAQGEPGPTGPSGPAGPACPSGYSPTVENFHGNQAIICEQAPTPTPSPSPVVTIP